MLRFLFAVFLSIVSFLVLCSLAAGWILLTTPKPTNIKGCFTTEMYQVNLCPTDANYTPIREIPAWVKMAVVVSEDGSFYDHNGFDIYELKQSLKKDWETGQFARGGSTITQQLAKNLYLTKEKSIFRKIREAIIASQIEDILTKEEILEKYFNVVEFGPNIFGIKAAAQYYFKKKVSQLSIAEGAWLAILLPNPTKNCQSFKRGSLSPFARREVSKTIKRLVSFRKISQEMADSALVEMSFLFSKIRPVKANNDLISPDDLSESLPASGSENFDDLAADLSGDSIENFNERPPGRSLKKPPKKSDEEPTEESNEDSDDNWF